MSKNAIRKRAEIFQRLNLCQTFGDTGRRAKFPTGQFERVADKCFGIYMLINPCSMLTTVHDPSYSCQFQRKEKIMDLGLVLFVLATLTGK
jgi:hypothetical protein